MAPIWMTSSNPWRDGFCDKIQKRRFVIRHIFATLPGGRANDSACDQDLAGSEQVRALPKACLVHIASAGEGSGFGIKEFCAGQRRLARGRVNQRYATSVRDRETVTLKGLAASGVRKLGATLQKPFLVSGPILPINMAFVSTRRSERISKSVQ